MLFVNLSSSILKIILHAPRKIHWEVKSAQLVIWEFLQKIWIFIFSRFSEREAAVMKANSWLYHYYMVQSRLQYSLAYGGQSPTSLAAFYPMQNSGFPAAHNFDGHMLHASFMSSASQAGGVSYPGYAGYTPPPGAYNLHASHYASGGSSQNLDQRSSDSPLDFSAAANQYGNNNSAWNDEMRNYEEKVVGFTDVNPSNGLDRTSSPEYR